MQDVLEGIITIAREAGAAILSVYRRDDFGIENKADDSPLTAADLAANAVILAGLKRLAPDIPVLSEESDEVPFSERQQ